MRRSPRGPDDAQRGWTLAELLVVAGILTLVVATVVPLLTVGQQAWNRTDRHAEMMQNARRAIDKLIRDLRAARSFQSLTPGLLRFVVASGDGSGASPIVEYRLDAATNLLEYRVGADFPYRRRMTVTAGSPGVTAGYSLVVTVDHASLVAAGKSLPNGDDVRILHWNGTAWLELDRFKDVLTAWNATSTRLWFRAQAPIPAGLTDNNYYLVYGDPSAGPAAANGDYVFLDYEDGTSLAGWTRRDGCVGTPSTSADGFVFTAGSGANCYRQMSKSVSHTDVEIFWGFQSGSTGDPSNNDRHMPGMGARRSDSGAGYLVTPGEDSNRRLRIRYVTSWTTDGSVIGQTARNSPNFGVAPGVSYYGRFYLVGSNLKAKRWEVGTPEPGWMLEITDSTTASGAYYAQVDGHDAPHTHRHRYVVVRHRVDPEPTVTVGAEQTGARVDAFQPLAGPFRSMSLLCYGAAGAPVGCATAAAVRSIQVTLIIMDPTGEVADVALTARAYRQAP